MIWPLPISPYHIHICPLCSSQMGLLPIPGTSQLILFPKAFILASKENIVPVADSILFRSSQNSPAWRGTPCPPNVVHYTPFPGLITLNYLISLLLILPLLGHSSYKQKSYLSWLLLYPQCPKHCLLAHIQCPINVVKVSAQSLLEGTFESKLQKPNSTWRERERFLPALPIWYNHPITLPQKHIRK